MDSVSDTIMDHVHALVIYKQFIYNDFSETVNVLSEFLLPDQFSFLQSRVIPLTNAIVINVKTNEPLQYSRLTRTTKWDILFRSSDFYPGSSSVNDPIFLVISMWVLSA